MKGSNGMHPQYQKMMDRMDDNNQAKKKTLMMTMAKQVNFGETGFHPFVVRYIPKPVQIIWMCRFPLVPTYKIRQAGANIRIRPFLLSASNIVLQENNRSLIFFRHASHQGLEDTVTVRP
jgi:hypothetical protein